jgi:hypothetical protein
MRKVARIFADIQGEFSSAIAGEVIGALPEQSWRIIGETPEIPG